MKSGRFIGVMSGTSLDGVDVVLAAIDETMVAQQASLTWPIPVHLKKGILDICQGQPLTLSQLGQLDTQLGRLFAQAVNALLAQQRLQPRISSPLVVMGKRSGMSRPARPRIRCKLAIIITSSPIRGLQWSAIFGGGILRWADKARRWCPLSITRCWDIRRKNVWS